MARLSSPVFYVPLAAMLALCGCLDPERTDAALNAALAAADADGELATVGDADALDSADSSDTTDAADLQTDDEIVDTAADGSDAADAEVSGISDAAVPDVADADAGCSPVDCSDGNPCTDDSCLQGACQHLASKDGTTCSGGSCSGGVCQGTATCGDGVVGGAEQCDDGNTKAGDGCGGTCLWECGAVAFDGTTGFITVADDPSLTLVQGDFTLEAMVRFQSNAAQQPLVAKRPLKGPGFGWSFGIFNGAIAFRVGGGADVTASAQVPGAVPVGKWLHIAAVYDSAKQTMRIYENGTLAATQSGMPNPALSTDPVRLGVEDAAMASHFHGDLAFVRLSANRQYLVEFKTPLSVAPDANTVAQWSMQGGSGATVTDVSGHGLDGAITGASLGPRPRPVAHRVPSAATASKPTGKRATTAT